MCGFEDVGAYFADMDFFEKEYPEQAERLQEQEFDEFLEDDEV